MSEQSSYHGLYINLDRSGGRRLAFERQLESFALTRSYARFPAIDGSQLSHARSALPPGETGCFFSHFRALESARPRSMPVHILEDDALLSEHARPVIEGAIAGNLFDRFDILFTDTFVNCHLGMLKSMKAAFDAVKSPRSIPLRLNQLQVIDLAQQNFACLTSYIVGTKSIDKILSLYQQEIAGGLKTPVDLFIRDAVHAGKLRAACLFPFVTSFNLEEVKGSTLHEKNEKPSVMVLAVLRYSFFANCDLGAATAHLDAALGTDRRNADPHHDLIVRALGFVMSDEFKEF
jgi:GR25 family glycosyltransferase involved in LPS biosynthesis